MSSVVVSKTLELSRLKLQAGSDRLPRSLPQRQPHKARIREASETQATEMQQPK